MPIQPDTKLLTTKQVAAKLNVHHKLVIRWIRDLSLPCYKFGRDYRFVEAEVDKWIEAHQYESEFDARRFAEDKLRRRRK